MTDRCASRRLAVWIAIAALSIAAGCGAKTGLLGDDAEPPLDTMVDAAEDVPVDVAPPRCIEVPEDGRAVAEVEVSATLAVVDLFFLVDATASMFDEIENVRNGLTRTVVPAVRELIPDAAFGLALVGEFPVSPHGPDGISPYELRVPVTVDAGVVAAALLRLPSWGNFDDPEAHIEGLYQVATGDGLEPFIAPSVGCPRGGSGGACFRPEALPVVVLITDAPSHNGPPGVEPVSPYAPVLGGARPHSYEDAIAALRELGVFVIGLGARDARGSPPTAHLRAIARDTDALDGSGEPLAFDIGDRGRVDERVVDAVQRLAGSTPLDVDVVVEDVAGDAYDARELVTAIAASGAFPMSGVARLAGNEFFGVTPGTQLQASLTVSAAGLPIPPGVRVPARVVFRAFSRSVIERVDVELVLGARCADP